MGKNPAECKNSMRFGDLYICKLQTIPCAALDRCALDVVDDLVEATASLVKLKREARKGGLDGKMDRR